MAKEKFFYAVACSTSNPDRAALPLVLASNALDAGHDVVVWFVTEGALLARKSNAEKFNSPIFGSVANLLQKVKHLGGQITVCGTCCAFYEIGQDDLAEGVEIKTAAWAVETSVGRNCLTF